MRIRAESWDHLLALLHADSWDARLRRHRPKYAFRGLTNAAYPLVPSLDRIGRHSQPAVIERLLLSDFRQYARSDASPGDSVWNWMAVAQHHGLPTRLIDWTYSPYVALHFATADLGCDVSRDDAVVWCVNYERANERLPEPMRRQLAEYRKQVFSVETLERVVASLAELDGLSREPFLFFLEPPSLDARIVNQAALFSVLSRPEHANDDVPPSPTLEEYLERHGADDAGDAAPLVKKIVIPADLKWEIRDRLDQGNVTERVVMPGLDGLSAWLKRHYTRRAAEGEEP